MPSLFPMFSSLHFPLLKGLNLRPLPPHHLPYSSPYTIL